MSAPYLLTRMGTPLLVAVCLVACAQAVPPSATPVSDPPRSAMPIDVLDAFPASLSGHQRHVVKLPPLDNEPLHRVELLGGKTLTVDCNRQSMDGHFEPREVPGRKPTYWVFTSQGQVMSTRMACPPGSDRREFVSAKTLLVPYNSRLPLVVFVPDGFELRWRPIDTRAAGLPASGR